MKYTHERTLCFTYSSDNFLSQTGDLTVLLTDNGISFECVKTDCYARFYVKKSGRKWNDIYKLVNSVNPARYRLL